MGSELNARRDDEINSALYTDLSRQMEERCGRPADAAAGAQILDYVRLEHLKDMAYADILARGLGRTASNGRQSYWKDNKSAVLILKYMQQQAKILKALGLGGAEPSAEDEADTDDFDNI